MPPSDKPKNVLVLPRPTYRCLVIGEGSLPLQCCDALIARGHTIQALVSASAEGHDWSHQNAITLLEPHADLSDTFASASVDFLFSIVNPQILSAEACGVAGRAAINYHDALLPQYAGVYATTWAIMAGERRHGVTWHEITQDVDAGRVYVQREVSISNDETALSLDVKCYEAAIASFVELLEGLEQDTITPRPQSLENRSYFARQRRPPAGATINWNQPAAMVSAFVRALDFGSRSNPIALPKIWLRDVPFACRAAEVLDDVATQTPGTVVAIDERGMLVSASDRLLRITQLTTLRGDAVQLSSLAVRVGDALDVPAGRGLARLNSDMERAARHEYRWVQRLTEVRAPVLPIVDQESFAPGEDISEAIVRLPSVWITSASTGNEIVLFAALVVYLARIGDGAPFDIAVQNEMPAACSPLFMTSFPLRCGFDLKLPFPDIVQLVSRELNELRKQGSIASDVLARYPSLRSAHNAEASTSRKSSASSAQRVLVSFGGSAVVAASDESAMSFVIAPDGLSATLQYGTTSSSRAAADRIVKGLEALLADAALHQTRAVAELEMMSADEYALVVHTWNDTREPYPRDSTITELFAAVCVKLSDAVAVSAEDGLLTYSELNKRANQLAHRLRRLGVTFESVVGLCIERSMNAIIAMLGILKAGGAYLPLDIKSPQSRLNQILSDSNVGIIVASRSAAGALFDNDASRKIQFAGDSSLSEESTEELTLNSHSESLAYLMYTSGSTGRPKGVAVTHRNIVRLVRNANYAQTGTDDVQLGFAPLAFDASTFEVWGALLNGGSVALFPDHLPTAEELGKFVEYNGVTTLFLTTALFNEVADNDLAHLRGVRQLLTGGEVSSPSHMRRFMRALPDCRLIHVYGPTENTTFSTWHPVSLEQLENPAIVTVPIGRAITNSTTYVLDSRQQPLPIGAIGELFVGGDGVARGYSNDAIATAASFINDPFSSTPNARLYATGDLARWRADGALDFVGRRDTQVKIRGYRIELEEIEAAFAKHVDVKQLAVVAQRDRSGNQRLVAFYVPISSSKRLPSSALREYLGASLPSYMVPAVYVALRELPLTASGKIDRAKLQHEAAYHDMDALDGPLPTSPVEIAVASIWRDVLNVPVVGTRDDFFSLGGHSLHAMQVLSRIANQFDVRLPLRTIFDNPTVERLAENVVNAVAEGQPTHVGGADADGSSGTAQPVSLGQEVLWLLQQTLPALNAYNVVEQWHIDGPVNVVVLERSLSALVERHAALRTTFVDSDAGPIQVVGIANPVRVAFVDARTAPETGTHEILQRAAEQAFDLSRDLPIRVTLLRENESSHQLSIVTHHIVDDGWSRAILRRELTELYDLISAGSSPVPTKPTHSYVTFAALQRASLSEIERRQHDDYWRTQLAGWQPTSYVRADRPRPTSILFDGAAVTAAISSDTVTRVQTVARENGATPFMVLLAAFQLLLHRYSGERDVVIGTVSASRDQREWEDVFGYFATPMAIRTSFADDVTFSELLRQVRDEQLRAMEHAVVPVEMVMTEPTAGEVAQPLPLFRVMCVLQNNERVALRLGNTIAREIPPATANAKFDLSLLLTEHDGALDATIEYRTSLFDHATIARLLEHFGVLLHETVSAPGSVVSRIPLIGAAERQKILAHWNAASAPSDDKCLHDLVNEQAQRTPNAVAVVGVDESLTYAELRRRVQWMARDLVARGVGPNVLVGVCVERSVHLVVALLAVLESGGAYVPLDPDYPRERLRFMMSDAAVFLVVTAGASSEALRPHDVQVLHLDDAYWTREIGDVHGAIAPPNVTADDLAYVIYTSGSSGQPKGAMNTHRAVCNFVRRSVELHGFTASDTVLQKTPASFDPSVWEIFGALTVGARLVLARPRGHADPAYLARVIAEQQVTAMNIVPSMLQALLEVPSLSAQATSLRIIVCGGEVMSPALQAHCFEVLPGVRLHNAYGPTEAAVNSCDWECQRNDTRTFVPIGKPLPNVHLYCLDEQREPVPAGVAGELYIGGSAVGAGYLGKPELTTERFISWPDPSRPEEFERLYRTGDIARMSPDGVIEYLGRRDHQIKLRGVRIELDEIESVLATHPALRAAIVQLREDAQNGERQIVGYVVAHAGATVSERTLREYLRGKLLDAMIPSAFVVLENLPISPTGKVDRDALPAPTYERVHDTTYIAPRTETELTLAGLAVAVLGVARVGIHDNFFEIGGHSLAAMSFVARAMRLGMSLSVSDVFDRPTLAGMANIVDAGSLSVQPLVPAITAIPRVARAAYRRTSSVVDK